MMGITTNLRRGLVTPWLWANWTSGIVSIQLAGNNGAMFLEQSVQCAIYKQRRFTRTTGAG